MSRAGQALVDPIAPTPQAVETIAEVGGALTGPAAPAGAFARLRAGRREKSENREEFEHLALAAAGGDRVALAALPEALATTRMNWRPAKLDEKLWEVLSSAVRDVIADDVMTSEEEDQLNAVASAMGLDIQALRDKSFSLFEEVVVAGINSGRFPHMPEPPMLLKRGEVAFGAFGCSLMKEVAVREFRGATQGVSIPIGGGIRYRVGGVRGRSVVVGSDLVAQDQGLLCVTSTRSLFTGQSKTLEFRHDKLVDVQQYTDAIRLNVSNRQTASLLKMNPGQSPSIAAALITAAVGQAGA